MRRRKDNNERGRERRRMGRRRRERRFCVGIRRSWGEGEGREGKQIKRRKGDDNERKEEEEETGEKNLCRYGREAGEEGYN